MGTLFRRPVRLLFVALVLIAIIGAVIFWGHRHNKPTVAKKAPVHPALTTQPIGTTGAPAKGTKSKVGATPYVRLIEATYPDFPTTRPLDFPLELSQASHLLLSDPIYLSPARDEMWITRPDAPPLENVLKQASDEKAAVDVHVLREQVAFVHWSLSRQATWTPTVIYRNSQGGYEAASVDNGRQPLPPRRDYYWEHAISWNDRVAVATASGVSIFHFGHAISEEHHEFARSNAPAQTPAEPRLLLDPGGLIAWIPWEAGKAGSRGAARYVPALDSTGAATARGNWSDLNGDRGWPDKILHLVPLLDGTVLLMTVDEQSAVQVQFNTIEHAEVKEQEIAALVEQLSDADQLLRNSAYDKLSQYGSGIWPILEKLMNDESPEAQSRMRQLLKQKVTPTLNGMLLLGSKTLKLVSRHGDGGTVFFAEAGVSIPNPDNPDAGPDYRVPAWISIRPGRPIELLPQTLTADLTPGHSALYANGNDWIVSQDGRGPRRFVGNGFVNLLRKSEQGFSVFVGTDRRGRWIFRRPASGATQPQSLILDPFLPDPTPRLPVWQFRTAEMVGWTRAGWPVAKSGSAYALHETDWQLVEESEPLYTKAEDAPPPVEPSPAPATQPSVLHQATLTTAPTTAPATTDSSDVPILTDRQGTRYFGGLTDLRLVTRGGKETAWALPAIANGNGPVFLIRTGDGRLFLFNQPGRVLRIKPTPGGAEPFKLEKMFTHRIPTVEHPTRIWLDPSGRIIMAWDNQLAMLFPQGYIPRPILEKIPPGDLDENEE